MLLKENCLEKGLELFCFVLFFKPLTISLPKRIIRLSKEGKHFLQKSSFGLIVRFLTRSQDGKRSTIIADFLYRSLSRKKIFF